MAANLDALDADLAAYEQLLRNNPGVAGLPGDIRGTAQNAISSVQELSAAFGDIAPNAAMSLEQVQGALSTIAPNRDPNIQKAKQMQANLAYRVAQMNNPSGEVSRQAFERSYEAISGGFFANNQSALEGVLALKDQSARNRIQVNGLRNPQAPTDPMGPPAPATPAAAETWERDPATGALRKVQ